MFDWGAMFKGIGDTFTAGAAANKLQSNERMAKLDRQLTREQLAALSDSDRLAYLANQARSENMIIYIVVISAIVLIVSIIIFRRRK